MKGVSDQEIIGYASEDEAAQKSIAIRESCQVDYISI